MEGHVAKIAAFPGHSAMDHWKGEARNWLCCVMSTKKRPLNGRPASTLGELPSKIEFTMPSKELRKLLGSIYHRFQKLENPKANAVAKQDFVFHMTDWLDDLRRLAAIYKNPGKFDRQSAGHIVAGFLYHVIPHLRAAGRLLLDQIPDAFENVENLSNERSTRARRPRRRKPSPGPR